MNNPLNHLNYINLDNENSVDDALDTWDIEEVPALPKASKLKKAVYGAIVALGLLGGGYGVSQYSGFDFSSDTPERAKNDGTDPGGDEVAKITTNVAVIDSASLAAAQSATLVKKTAESVNESMKELSFFKKMGNDLQLTMTKIIAEACHGVKNTDQFNTSMMSLMTHAKTSNPSLFIDETLNLKLTAEEEKENAQFHQLSKNLRKLHGEKANPVSLWIHTTRIANIHQ